MSADPVRFVFSTGATGDTTTVTARVLVSKAQDYDVLLGQDVLFQIGAVIDGWQGQFHYHPDYRTDGVRLAAIPLLRPRLHARSAMRLPRLALVCSASSTSSSITPPLSYDSDGDEEERAAILIATRPRLQPVQLFPPFQVPPATELYIKAAATPFPFPRLQPVVPTSHPHLRPIQRDLVPLPPASTGYVILDLFSGISTQLRACLHNNMKIRAYYAVENDEISRNVALKHIRDLQQEFPHLLPDSAVCTFQSILPNDIQVLQRSHLAMLPAVDLVFAGWECQGHSSAGIGLGLADPRSALFYELVRVINHLEDIQVPLPPAIQHPFSYIFENVASQFDRRQHIRDDFLQIQHYIGQPVIIDAARHGARAHRLRALWTNLVSAGVLSAANQLVTRDLRLTVDDILDVHHRAQICKRADPPPFYPANEVGRPLNALPTLVSYPGSYAFRNGGPGMVYNTHTHRLEEPTAAERERAMEFHPAPHPHRTFPRLNADVSLARPWTFSA